MLHVLIGDDDYSIHEALGEIKKSIGDPTVLAANTTVLDSQVTLVRLQGACETVPFLAEKRLVVIEGLLARFEPKRKSGRNKAGRSTDQTDEYRSIAGYVSRVPAFTELVLVDGKISERNPLLRELSAVVRVSSFPSLRDSKLGEWIVRRVKQAGGSISTQAIQLLTRFVGGNLWIMANEVDKLVQFTGGRRIEEADVRAVVSYAQEANVFHMVDDILEFRGGAAQEQLQQLLKQGTVPAYLLVMLSRQVQLIFRVKELTDQGKSRSEIQSKLGLSADFVLRKALAQADKYSRARLKEVYHRLLEADLAIKTGEYEGELALNILIAHLSQGGKVAGLKTDRIG